MADNGDGNYTATLTASGLAGSATISGTVNGSSIVGDASVTFTTIVALVVVTPDGASVSGVGATQMFTAEATAAGNAQVTIAAIAQGVVGYGLLAVAVPGLEPVNLWSVMSSPTTEVLKGVWGTAGSDVYAVGNGGAILHYDGSTWSPMRSPNTENLHAVWGSSSSDMHAVGGAIIHYDGTSWSFMSSPTDMHLVDIWASPDSDVFAIGHSGTILRGIRGGSVLVTPNVVTLNALGDTLRLSVQARDAADNPVTGVTFTWNSSDEAVAAVDSLGLVTAVANGVATITATASGGAAGSSEITVDEPPPTVELMRGSRLPWRTLNCRATRQVICPHGE